MYQIGQYIMYRNIGICKVEAIGRLSFSANKEKDYYTLCPLNANNSKVYVPVDRDLEMRKIMTKEEAGEYLEMLREMKTKPVSSSKPGALTAHYQEILAPHDMKAFLTLFKELRQKEKMVRENGKHLGQLDMNYKSEVERLLSDEFAYAFGETPKEAKERLCEIADAE